MNEGNDNVLIRLADAAACVEPRPDWVNWVLQEVVFERRDAQAVADEAYAHWTLKRTGEAYAVYRAAQDRADAAQDELAAVVAGSA